MKRHTVSWAILLVFLLLIGGFPLSWYLLPESVRTANSENRILSEFPKPESAEDLLHFSERFETWYSDHMPYKEQLVSAKSQAEIGLLQELSSDQVILGTEVPWLFYKADDGQAIETYKRTNQFSQENLEKITEVLTGLSERLSEEGTEFLLVIAPDKETIYGPRYMPSEIRVMKDRPHRTEQLIAYLAEHAPNIRVCYPKEEMLSAGETAEDGEAGWPLYYESDTHWNKIGAKHAADAIYDSLSETDAGWTLPETEIRFTDRADGSDAEGRPEGSVMYKEGDMQRLCRLPAKYDSREFRAEGTLPAALVCQVSAPSGESVYERYRAEDARCAKKSMYLVADSFRWNITEFLCGSAETCTIASRYYLDLSDVEEQHPDVFVYMLAERYLHELEGLPGVAAPALSYTEEFQRTDFS